MQLAVFMDGTWNDPADDTNADQPAGRVPEVERGPGGRGQRTHHIKGVGNGPGTGCAAASPGRGVDDNIREATRSRRQPPAR
ncbi:hypothetical protein HBB16_15950 [Pseudonocardia sp. MCCB 268]|nr:hypothetical protein [Pseudonocardia cytotoxica]